ncbi:fumarylacetoacetate hydrolase family protein [Stygiolobus caldivivus]|uniref:2-hydroxyhepta-2,4-diene-1,7-dioate isomerase n=1 Tax=Stygiolobus caldivivus TaxID=2824673 RepID=A0A8D5ZJU4_9CREN|nr:fumarylacetoacetate hydrolase family protein [Stygiolobus caldivivus]BCU71011.1 2-hydroxyhepta-2,4-diene-1,7-dioate isomerase [Stygiolobus caldivivus]
MRLGFALTEDGRKVVVVYEEDKFLEFDKEGLDCVFSDINKVISAFDVVKDLPLKEVMVKKLLPPVNPRKVFLPAVNFRSHSSETSMAPPPFPYFFTKFNNAIIGNEDYILIPKELKRTDYEGEIGVVIGKRAKNVSRGEAMDYVFGFTVVNDVSFRDYQFPEVHPYGLNWVMGKGLDTGLPVGPWIVTKDEVDFYSLEIKTRVNGVLVQNGVTKDMVFSVEDMISYLSKGITLEPGDIITTGTPAGVAEFSGKKYLQEGDVVEVEVKGIGVLRNYVKTI